MENNDSQLKIPNANSLGKHKRGHLKNVMVERDEMFKRNPLLDDNIDEEVFATKEIDLRLLLQLQKEFEYYVTYQDVTSLKTFHSKKKLQDLKKNYAKNYSVEEVSTFKKWFRRVFATKTLLVTSILLLAVFSLLSIQRKPIILVLDGEYQYLNTRHFNEAMLIDRIVDKYNLTDYKVTRSENNLLLIKNERIEIVTKKKVNGLVGLEEYSLDTYAITYQDVLKELEKKYNTIDKKYDWLVSGFENKNLKKAKLKSKNNIDIILVSIETREEEKVKGFDIEYKDNADLLSGTLKTIQEGKEHIEILKYERIFHNDKLFTEKVSVSSIKQQGQNTIIERGTRTINASDSVWDQLANCETGGSWHANTGNGYYGGLQFSLPTWRNAASKVGVTAAYPHEASKEDQIKAAVWLQQKSGWGQWPACSAKLGLR